MGGLGSGRPGGWGRDTVESCRSLDINRLQREGCLRPGWSGRWQWSREGKQLASIQLRTDDTHLHLSYRIRIGGGDRTPVDEAVTIAQVPCRLGGSRPYFICPGILKGIACRRQVVKLYGAGRYFLCRHCYRLAYASQREDALDRVRRRGANIRRRLGGDPNFTLPFPARPKGMWHRTYKHLRGRAMASEIQAEEIFEMKACQLLARSNRRHGKGSFWS